MALPAHAPGLGLSQAANLGPPPQVFERLEARAPQREWDARAVMDAQRRRVLAGAQLVFSRRAARRGRGRGRVGARATFCSRCGGAAVCGRTRTNRLHPHPPARRRVMPLEVDPRAHPLWRLAEQFGGGCALAAGPATTHVVATHGGTEKARRVRASPRPFGARALASAAGRAALPP